MLVSQTRLIHSTQCFFSSMLFFLWDIKLDINYHAYLICSMLKDGNLYSMILYFSFEF